MEAHAYFPAGGGVLFPTGHAPERCGGRRLLEGTCVARCRRRAGPEIDLVLAARQELSMRNGRALRLRRTSHRGRDVYRGSGLDLTADLQQRWYRAFIAPRRSVATLAQQDVPSLYASSTVVSKR